MAVPLYDMTSVIVIRLRAGRSPFRGDRRHFSHRLVERGLTPPQAVRTIDLVTLAGGLGALLLHRLDAAGACVVTAQTLCLLGVVALLEFSSASGTIHAAASTLPDPTSRDAGPGAGAA
jgi:UDP-GlcNAc:undecaprenyl-phosphate GlcNAc-1-phosphate transferase